MIRQAVVAAGGKGTRLGQLAKKYGNKSLIPIEGKPILLHTIQWLEEAGVKHIIVTVNYQAQYEIIQKLVKGNSAVQIMKNSFRKSSVHCIIPLRALLGRQFLFVYGHAPPLPEHIRQLVNAGENELAVSLYKTTSQADIKAVNLEGDRIQLNRRGSLYIEPPHLLNQAFAEIVTRCGSWKEAFQRYRRPIVGVVANRPHEFHYLEDLTEFSSFMKEAIQKRSKS